MTHHTPEGFHSAITRLPVTSPVPALARPYGDDENSIGREWKMWYGGFAFVALVTPLDSIEGAAS
jgi:hypothetical protein